MTVLIQILSIVHNIMKFQLVKCEACNKSFFQDSWVLYDQSRRFGWVDMVCVACVMCSTFKNNSCTFSEL